MLCKRVMVHKYKLSKTKKTIFLKLQTRLFDVTLLQFCIEMSIAVWYFRASEVTLQFCRISGC